MHFESMQVDTCVLYYALYTEFPFTVSLCGLGKDWERCDVNYPRLIGATNLFVLTFPRRHCLCVLSPYGPVDFLRTTKMADCCFVDFRRTVLGCS